MKRLRIAVLLLTVISLMGLILACPSGSSGSASSGNKTPAASQYEINGNRNVTEGTALTITVAKKAGVDASDGDITATKYNNSDSTTPAYNSTTPPTAVGLYDVKIDVAAGTGWDPISGLLVGSVSIRSSGKTPLKLSDFDLTDFPNGMGTYKIGDPENMRPAVKVKSTTTGVTNANIKTYYGQGNTTFPTSPGVFVVSFDVDPPASSNYAAVAGLSAGLLTVTDSGGGGPTVPTIVTQITPASFDVLIAASEFKPEIYDGKDMTGAMPVFFQDEIITAKIQNRAGVDKPYPNVGTKATIQYWKSGANSTKEDFETTGTMIANPYKVEANGYWVRILIPPFVNLDNTEAWGSGEVGGELELRLPLKVNIRTPTADDFDYDLQLQSEAGTFLGNTITVQHVKITAKPKYVNMGTVITRFYTGKSNDLTIDSPAYPDPLAKAIPQRAGTYSVKFDVDAPLTGSAGEGQWAGATGLEVPAITSNSKTGGLIVDPLMPVNPAYTNYFWFDQDKDVLTVLETNGVYYNKLSKRYEYVANVDKDGVLFGNGLSNAPAPVTFTFKKESLNPASVKWLENGKEKEDFSKPDGGLVNGKDNLTYTFTKTALGWHWVTLVVQTMDQGTTVKGKLYSETVYIRVQKPQQ